jgi:fructose/tagatose bisphosphate aldolase
MAFVSYRELMEDAENHKYAVGYFESWDLQSLLAVCDAAEAMKSPVIIGFSGVYFPNYENVVKNTLSIYAELLKGLSSKLSVPVCTIFNESPYIDLVMKSIDYGFGIVMLAREGLSFYDKIKQIKKVVGKAHKNSVAVEGEIKKTPYFDGNLDEIPGLDLTDIESAELFVNQTKIDSFAINIGQIHTKTDKKAHLNFSNLKILEENIQVPLVSCQSPIVG